MEVIMPVAFHVLGEKPQRRGDRREGQVEFGDLFEREEGDLLGLGARGKVREGSCCCCCCFAFSAAVLHEPAAEEEVGLPDCRDVLL